MNQKNFPANLMLNNSNDLTKMGILMLYIGIPTVYFIDLSLCSQVILFLSIFIGSYLLRRHYNGPSNIHHPDLKGKFILVTGGTDGIGAECVREFAKLGADIIFTGRDAKKANEVINTVENRQREIAKENGTLNGLSFPKTNLWFKKCDFGELKQVLDLVQWIDKE